MSMSGQAEERRTEKGALYPAKHWPSAAAIAQRARLRELQNEFVKKATRARYSDAESLEWARMPDEHRMSLMLFADLDGDLGALAQRDWREFPPHERSAVKEQARRARSVFGVLHALTGRW